MVDVSAVLFDVGGVLLTNAWDHSERQHAIQQFALDWQSFETRHEQVVAYFETGRMSLDEYLKRTVFYESRIFTPDAFKQVMFAQSQPYLEALELVAELACTRRYLLATLNNESRELNEYRIRTYRLREYFTVFLSSCFLGVRKPDAEMYRTALDITQRSPDECLFVDDRPTNVEAARAVGMRTLRYEGVPSLREALK